MSIDTVTPPAPQPPLPDVTVTNPVAVTVDDLPCADCGQPATAVDLDGTNRCAGCVSWNAELGAGPGSTPAARARDTRQGVRRAS